MKFQLRNARLSFPDLFEATQVNGQGGFNYRSQFLVPASGDGAEIRKDVSEDPTKTTWGPWGPAKEGIEKAIADTAKAKWNAKAGPILAANEGIPQKHCFIDGKKRAYDGYEGNWALSASRPLEKGRPMVVDADKSPLVAADGKPYAGCYVNAVVSFWAQDNQHGKAVRCELVSVQFAKDGDSFGGGGTKGSEDDFEDISTGANAEDLV